jgi:hypothetical protein
MDAIDLIDVLRRDFGLSRSLRWVRQQQKDRTLPYIKWGKMVFFAASQIKVALDPSANC